MKNTYLILSLTLLLSNLASHARRHAPESDIQFSISTFDVYISESAEDEDYEENDDQDDETKAENKNSEEPSKESPKPVRDTTLLSAIKRGAKCIPFELLSRSKPKIDAQDADGDTALLVAIMQNDTNLVEELLAHGANPDITNKRGWNALNGALSMKNSDNAMALIAHHADVNYPDPILHVSPLFRAIVANDDILFKALLQAGADVTKTFNGETALHVAVKEQNRFMVDELIKAGIAVDAQTSQGFTALHLAAYLGSGHLVKTLLAAGASINVTDKDGDRAIDFATMQRHCYVTSLLLDYEAAHAK